MPVLCDDMIFRHASAPQIVGKLKVYSIPLKIFKFYRIDDAFLGWHFGNFKH